MHPVHNLVDEQCQIASMSDVGCEAQTVVMTFIRILGQKISYYTGINAFIALTLPKA